MRTNKEIKDFIEDLDEVVKDPKNYTGNKMVYGTRPCFRFPDSDDRAQGKYTIWIVQKTLRWVLKEEF